MAYHVRLQKGLELGGERLQGQGEGGEGPAEGEAKDLFFDESSRHIILVRMDMDATIISLDGAPPLQIRIGSRGSIIFIKLSLDKTTLAVQRSLKMIELIDLSTNTVFPLSCKSSKTATKILGFYWTYKNEIAVVTNYSIEYFQTSLSQAPKFLKSVSVNINWCIYSPETKVLLVALGGSPGTGLQGYHFKDSNINRLPRFDITLTPCYADPVLNKMLKLKQKDVSLALIYGRVYCLHLSDTPQTTEIVLYQITREAVTKKAVLKLNSREDFVVNIIDNLIVAHSIQSKLSMIFDIKSSSSPEKEPIVSPLPLEPVFISPRTVPLSDDNLLHIAGDDNVAYRRDWIAFYPDGIVSRELFCYWTVTISLENIVDSFTDKSLLLDFLLRRRGSRTLIMDFMRSTIEKRTNIPVLSKLFDQLNAVCSSVAVERAYDKAAAKLKEKERRTANSSFLSEYLGLVNSSSDGDLVPHGNHTPLQRSNSSHSVSSPPSPSFPSPRTLPSTSRVDKRVSKGEFVSEPKGQAVYFTSVDPPTLRKNLTASSLFDETVSYKEVTSPKGLVIIDQENLYSCVFVSMQENQNLPFRYIVSVLVEYIRSLNQFQLPVNHYIYEMVINLLVSNQRFYQLHQFLQYHVVRDSVHVACLLLSLETKYPPAYQLAIDMLKRLGTVEQIVEVLLLKKQVLTALRFTRSNGITSISPSRFLEAALTSDDKMLFFSVFKYFEEKNIAATGKPDFPPSDQCKRYVMIFQEKFKSPQSA